MFIFSILIIIALIIIIKQLAGIKITCDKIEEMATMSEEQRHKYSLKIDDPDEYDNYIQANYWDDEVKRKKKNREILELVKRQPKLSLKEIAERYGESELSVQIIINEAKKKKLA